MRNLKSLKELETSSNVIDSRQLKNITGGGVQYWWDVTTTTAGDRVEMAREGRWVGGEWHWTGPAWATGKTMTVVVGP